MLAEKYGGLRLNSGSSVPPRGLSEKCCKGRIAYCWVVFHPSLLSTLGFRGCQNCAHTCVHKMVLSYNKLQGGSDELINVLSEGSLGRGAFQHQSLFNYLLPQQTNPQGCLTSCTSLTLSLCRLFSPRPLSHI